MNIEFSLNPNCSESVYRFNKSDIKRLPEKLNSIKKLLKLNGASLKPIEECGFSMFGSYSKLRAKNKEQICIYFYQTDCPELEISLIDSKIDYKAEKPFLSEIKTKKKNLLKGD